MVSSSGSYIRVEGSEATGQRVGVPGFRVEAVEFGWLRGVGFVFFGALDVQGFRPAALSRLSRLHPVGSLGLRTPLYIRPRFWTLDGTKPEPLSLPL